MSIFSEYRERRYNECLTVINERYRISEAKEELFCK